MISTLPNYRAALILLALRNEARPMMQGEVVDWIERYLQGWPEITDHDPNTPFDNHAKFDKAIKPLIENRLVQQKRPKSPYQITTDGIAFVSNNTMTASNWPDWPIAAQYQTRKAVHK